MIYYQFLWKQTYQLGQAGYTYTAYKSDNTEKNPLSDNHMEPTSPLWWSNFHRNHLIEWKQNMWIKNATYKQNLWHMLHQKVEASSTETV